MTTASVFTGVKLSNESRGALLDLFRKIYGDLLDQVKAQHLTLHFRGSPDKISSHIMGQMVSFRLIGILQCDGIQIAEVKPLGLAKELDYDSTPHVTISINKGIRPSVSKQVLRDNDPDIIGLAGEELIIKGQVGFIHDRHGWVFIHLDEEEMVPTPRT